MRNHYDHARNAGRIGLAGLVLALLALVDVMLGRAPGEALVLVIAAVAVMLGALTAAVLSVASR